MSDSTPLSLYDTFSYFWQHVIARMNEFEANMAEPYTLPVATANTLGGVKIGNGISVGTDGKISVSTYSLPTASSSTLGGIKVGSGLSINTSGVLSATATSYTLPVATASTLGGVKMGNGISATTDGTISINLASNSALSVSSSGLKLNYAYGFWINGSNQIGIQTRDGLLATSTGLGLVLDSNSGLSLSSSGLSVNVGSGLKIDDNGAVANQYSMSYDSSTYTLSITG